MQLLQLRVDLDSTAVPLPVKGQGHSDVTSLAADPLSAVTDLIIYLGFSAAANIQVGVMSTLGVPPLPKGNCQAYLDRPR